MDVDTSTDLKLSFEFQRRHLAFELVSLLSYDLRTTWLDKLMSALMSETLASFGAISLTQILQADREIFAMKALEHAETLKAATSAKLPLDAVLNRLMRDPRSNMHLIACQGLSPAFQYVLQMFLCL